MVATDRRSHCEGKHAGGRQWSEPRRSTGTAAFRPTSGHDCVDADTACVTRPNRTRPRTFRVIAASVPRACPNLLDAICHHGWTHLRRDRGMVDSTNVRTSLSYCRDASRALRPTVSVCGDQLVLLSSPRASDVREMGASTPGEFLFAVKVPRLITHERELKRSRVPFEQFVAETACLEGHRGPLLLQRLQVHRQRRRPASRDSAAPMRRSCGSCWVRRRFRDSLACWPC